MEQQKSKCEHKKMIIIDEIIQCVSCGKTKYDIDREQPKESSWETEFDKEFTEDGGEEFGLVLTEIHPYRLKRFIQETLDKQKEEIKEKTISECALVLIEHIRTGGDVATTMLVNQAIKESIEHLKSL